MCSCEIDGGCYLVRGSSGWRTAAKLHRCSECQRRVIKPGDLHWYIGGLWTGEETFWEEYRVCARCEAKRRAHSKAEAFLGNDGCSAPLGFLRQTMTECEAEDMRYRSAFKAAMREIRRVAA